MGLNLIDIREGTIVDHTFEVGEDEKKRLRPIRRRGIIVQVDGNGHDSVSRILVQFKPKAEPEAVQAKELVRVYPATSAVARRALRRAKGESELVGAEFQEKAAPIRPKLEDSMGLTGRKTSPFVLPEGKTADDEDEVGLE